MSTPVFNIQNPDALSFSVPESDSIAFDISNPTLSMAFTADGIAAQGGSTHTHANLDILNTITAIKVSNWDAKADEDDIPTALSVLSDDSMHRTVTDTEKQVWNAKANTNDIPTTLSELTSDSTHRTVTDAEKDIWNSGSDGTIQHITLDGTELEITDHTVDIPTVFQSDPFTGVILKGHENYNVRIDTVRLAELIEYTTDPNPAYISTEDNIHFTFLVSAKVRFTALTHNTSASSSKPMASIYKNDIEIVRATSPYNTQGSEWEASVDILVASGDIITCGNPTTNGWPASGMTIEILELPGYSYITSINGQTTSNHTINIDIPSSLSDLTADSSHRTVTDTEKNNWNQHANVYILQLSNNTEFNSTDAVLTLSSSIIDINGNTWALTGLRDGDLIMVFDGTVPNRYIYTKSGTRYAHSMNKYTPS